MQYYSGLHRKSRIQSHDGSEQAPSHVVDGLGKFAATLHLKSMCRSMIFLLILLLTLVNLITIWAVQSDGAAVQEDWDIGMLI